MQTLLHTDAFTHRSFYTDAFTHKSFYAQKLLHTEAFTQTLLHTKAFTHRSFYTQTLLHIQTLSHTDTFTHITFTHRHFYTQALLDTNTFTHRRFYTQTLLHTEAVLKRLGRLVGDQERNKSSYSYTKFDINPRERRQMLGKCQLVMATGGTVSQDLTMQWSTMGGFMQDLSLMVIDEGQQYGTDREIATISLLRTQPLILWTGDAQQTPGGLARAAHNAKRSRQLLLAN